MTSPARPRSPLIALAVMGAAGAFGVLCLVVARDVTRTAASGPAESFSTSSSPAPARPPAWGIPKLVLAVAPARLTPTAGAMAELASLEAQARARAAAAVGLTSDEQVAVAWLYHEGDRRRAQIEAEIDGDSDNPRLRSPYRLYGHESKLLGDISRSLGKARAFALREAEALALDEIARAASERPGQDGTIDEALFRRRLSASRYLVATIQTTARDR